MHRNRITPPTDSFNCGAHTNSGADMYYHLIIKSSLVPGYWVRVADTVPRYFRKYCTHYVTDGYHHLTRKEMRIRTVFDRCDVATAHTIVCVAIYIIR